MPTVLDLALVADKVYSSDVPTEKAARAAGWLRSLPRHISRIDPKSTKANSGFSGGVYKVGSTYVVAFRGSDDSDDWIGQNANTWNRMATQFAPAMTFAENAIKTYGLTPSRMVIVGHSLGGGLCKYVAHNLFVNGTPPGVAISFNGPGLSPGQITRAMITAAKLNPVTSSATNIATLMLGRTDTPTRGKPTANIHNINVKGDPVSAIGSFVGTERVISTPPPASKGTSSAFSPWDFTALGMPSLAMKVGERLGRKIKKTATDAGYFHGMDAVFAALASSKALAGTNAFRL